MTKFGVAIAGLVLLNMGFSFAHAAEKTISDSIVSNLDCSSLSKDTILKSVRPERFSVSFHYPLTNWGNGQCWAMSRMQRIFGYLAKTDGSPTDAELEIARSIFRQYTSEPNDSGAGTRSVYTAPQVFTFPAPGRFQRTVGWDQSLKFDQALQSDLLASQSALGVEIGGGAANGLQYFKLLSGLMTEADVAKEIDQSLSEGWRPMIGIYGKFQGIDKNAGHAVLIESSQKLNEQVTKYAIYDSNNPGDDSAIYYDKSAGFQPGPGNDDFFPKEMKVVVISDYDRREIKNALYDYYSKACSR
jgi:hypothetical protein